MGPAPRKLYSISELVAETGVPRKSLILLLEQYEADIPSLVDGSRRRYPPEAIPAILRAWRDYKRGIKEEKGETEWFDKTLEKIRTSGEQLREVSGALRKVQEELRSNRPHRIFYINSFPGGGLQPARAIAVHVDTEKTRSRATLLEADLEAFGENDRAAVMNLREVIVRTFLRLEQENSKEEAEQLAILASLIRSKKAT